VPRDRAGTHLPPIAVKRQRRLTGVDEVVLSFVCERADHRGDLSTLRGDLRRDGERGDDLADHRQGDARRCSRGRPGHWTACTQRSSSMRVPPADVVAGRVAVLVMPEVLGHLLVERGLQDRLGQLLEQPIRPGQGQALLPSSTDISTAACCPADPGTGSSFFVMSSSAVIERHLPRQTRRLSASGHKHRSGRRPPGVLERLQRPSLAMPGRAAVVAPWTAVSCAWLVRGRSELRCWGPGTAVLRLVW